MANEHDLLVVSLRGSNALLKLPFNVVDFIGLALAVGEEGDAVWG